MKTKTANNGLRPNIRMYPTPTNGKTQGQIELDNLVNVVVVMSKATKRNPRHVLFWAKLYAQQNGIMYKDALTYAKDILGRGERLPPVNAPDSVALVDNPYYKHDAEF